jgi:hypothetical protein
MILITGMAVVAGLAWIWPWRRARQRVLGPAIEAVLGHCETDSLLGRNFLKDRPGDYVNTVMSAVGYHFRLILKWLKEVLRLIIAAIWAAIVPQISINSLLDSRLSAALGDQ